MKQFKGWDWTEFAYYWKLAPSQKLKKMHDVEIEKLIDDYLVSGLIDNKKRSKKIVKDVKLFLTKLASTKEYSAPLWRGLINVKDDFTFIQITRQLLTSMWS